MSAKEPEEQALFDALASCSAKKVLESLHGNITFRSDVLSDHLLYFVKSICQRDSFSENISNLNSPSVKEYDIVYMLLDAGADIDRVDESGNTCLFYAVLNENYQLCDVLLQCGADMWACTEDGISIYDYVSGKNIPTNLIATFNKFYPGLWKAVECENIYQVRQLINYWCRTNLKKDGLTLKDITLQTGNEEIINLILGVCESMDLVYHIFAKNTEAVKKALATNKRKIRLNLRKMSDHGAPILYYLIQSRDIPTIELFMKYDCQIYTIMRDHMGNDMPVMFSALKPDMSVDVLEALLPKNKIQLEEILYKILYKGMTVLEVAMERKVSSEILKLLIDRGGPLLLCDHNQFNESVLDIAISLNDQSYIDAIDQCVHEWILNPSQYDGRRLKLALLGWRFEPVQYMENGEINENVSEFLSIISLLQGKIKKMSNAIEKADVENFISLKNSVYDMELCEANMLWHARIIGDGMPLLHRAVLFNRPEIVEIILDEKPPKESIDSLFDQNHRTALHYAFACSQAKKIQKLLLSYGCSEHVLDKMNKEPLDFKEKQDSPIIIELIERLKSKDYSEYEPNPWNSKAANDIPGNTFQNNECCREAENLCSSSSGYDKHEFGETANFELANESEYEYYSEESASEDEEERHTNCQIS